MFLQDARRIPDLCRSRIGNEPRNWKAFESWPEPFDVSSSCFLEPDESVVNANKFARRDLASVSGKRSSRASLIPNCLEPVDGRFFK